MAPRPCPLWAALLGAWLPVAAARCQTARFGDECWQKVRWAQTDGIYSHPEWYPGLSPDSSFVDFQREVHQNWEACKLPCSPEDEEAPVAAFPDCCNTMGENTSTQTYVELHVLNCHKVHSAREDFNEAERLSHLDPAHTEALHRDWEARSNASKVMCRRADELARNGWYREAAILAVQAWGDGIMKKREYCCLVHPPYCIQTGWTVQKLIHTPVGVLACVILVLFLLTTIVSCIERTRRHYVKSKAIPHAPAAPVATPPPTGTVGRPARMDLEELLFAEWMERSSLRHLPYAGPLARSSASLFAALQEKFDFQVDNCRNQFEHFMSLWRSHVAMVADRHIGKGKDVPEGELLIDGLLDMYEDLMDGYRRWRRCFKEELGYPDVKAPPTLGEARWVHVGPSALTTHYVQRLNTEELSRMLAEIAAYLLTWGEAGNLRFMPEVVYFITSLVLTAEADPTRTGHLLGDPAIKGRSNLFLSKVVRPIYHVVFDEWYKYVRVETQWKVDNSLLDSASPGLRYCFSKRAEDEDHNREPAAWGSQVKGLTKGDGWLKVGDRFLPMEVDGVEVLTLQTRGRDKWKDIKKLKKGFDCYLPADVANYDDWDEFFYDPERLSAGLVLQGEDGGLLFDLPIGQRFAALCRVDWARSLRPSVVKTHREIHSFWGVYAATHRIWLLHAVLFVLAICIVAGDPPPYEDAILIGGRSMPVRFAAVGLLVPAHTLLWAYARWLTASHAVLWRCRCKRLICKLVASVLWAALWFAPLFTYAAIRWKEYRPEGALPFGLEIGMNDLLLAHFLLSTLGLFSHLVIPSQGLDLLWRFTPVPLHVRVARYLFWLAVLSLKFVLDLYVVEAVYVTTQSLNLVSLGREYISEIGNASTGADWSGSVLQWLVVWFMTFVLFITDTQLWFILGCTCLGVITTFAQRGCRMLSWATEDARALIPRRFSEKVLPYTRFEGHISEKFPEIWNGIVDLLYSEDKVKNVFEKGDLSYGSVRRKLFLNTSVVERFARQYCGLLDENGLHNTDLRWRIDALSRGLGLPMPRPFRLPFIPGITVLIPHYGETILVKQGELWNDGKEETVPLVDWLTARYKSEFEAFTNRMDKGQQHRAAMTLNPLSDWPEAGSNWSEYREHHWDKICTWASMRLQTLYRTVAGMVLYDQALQCHFEAQGLQDSLLAKTWSPSDCFNCLVSMQMYKTFNETMLQHTNKMFAKFPPSLKVAYIDWEDKDASAQADAVHERQERRYFSCLIDGSCELREDQKREPRLRVELPGFPILGDGKGDNQNHAIPFMRGSFCQCIDANQGAYFEQMLMLPCVLGEFRTLKRGDNGSKRIIGLPEHITSDFGSIGDFAAGSEIAFGTILQRSYSVLGGRMHYGHPDIMNKEFMMQQGGVSKATKTLNLSEDIFAGMDFTLRGGGRHIRHCEYFHLAKGRDLGFNTVLGFFSKLSSGAGEQIITRQMFRLGQLLHLPECLTFYYAHVGYYFTQAFISWGIPIVIFAWMLVLFSDCEDTFRSFMNCPHETAALSYGRMLSLIYSALLFAFLFATSLPLFVEHWMERGLKTALARTLMQYATLSPLLFIFQTKIIGHYVMNELRYGGATYVSTGRGLPTERRPFIGNPDGSKGFRIKDKDVGGLYLDYTVHTYHHGMLLLSGIIVIFYLGGLSDAGGYKARLGFTWFATFITLVSWLYAPFLFNPYQFSKRFFKKDLRAWVAFFFHEGGRKWVSWYETKFLKPVSDNKIEGSLADLSFIIFLVGLAAVFSNMYRKIRIFVSIYAATGIDTDTDIFFTARFLVPPIFCSFAMALAAALVEGLFCAGSSVSKRQSRILSRMDSDEEASSSAESQTSTGSFADPEARCQMFQRRPCRAPLALCALAAIILNVAEAIYPLFILKQYDWKKAFVAGVVLKFMLFEGGLNVCETLLRWRLCCGKRAAVKRERCWTRPMQLWVHSNRMALDIICSAFIFWTLAPLVLANSLNDWVAPGLNIHQLLIYRAAHLSPNQLDERANSDAGSEGSINSAENLLALGHRHSSPWRRD